MDAQDQISKAMEESVVTDRSRKSRRSRCVPRAVFNETSSWVPDPVAEEKGDSPDEAKIEEKPAGDWMTLASKRIGRVEYTMLWQTAREGRGERKAVMAEDTADFEENVEELKAEVAALKLQLIQQREKYANHFGEERQHRLKQQEDKARARTSQTKLDRIEHLKGLLANEAQRRVQARLEQGTSESGVGMGESAGGVGPPLRDGVEQHREVVEVPRCARAPRYTRILWVCGIVLGAFGLLTVMFFFYLNVTYGPKVV